MTDEREPAGLEEPTEEPDSSNDRPEATAEDEEASSTPPRDQEDASSNEIEVPPEVIELLSLGEELPPDKKQQQKIAALKLVERAEFFSGPLPPPRILRQYNEIVPGSAENIIRQFTDQSEHRRYLEKLVIERDVRRADYGLLAGFIVGITGVVGSLVLIGLGHEGAGVAALLTTLSPIVGSLIYVNLKRRKELAEKAREVPEKRS